MNIFGIFLSYFFLLLRTFCLVAGLVFEQVILFVFLDINSLSIVQLTKIPSHSVCFPSLNRLFLQLCKSFQFYEIPLFSRWPQFLCKRSPIHKPLPSTYAMQALPMFSFSTCRISGFTFGSLIYLELVFVQGDRYGYNFVPLPVDFSFPGTISENAVFSPLNAFFSLLSIRGCGYKHSCLFHWPTCLLCQYCYYYYGSVIFLKMEW